MKLIDLTGKKFGRLMVIRRGYPDSRNGNARWLCRCGCGIEKVIDGRSLRKGRTKSCGCLRKKLASEKRKLDFGLATKQHLIRNYRRRARERGYSFNLTEEYFFELTQQDCHYCGIKPSQVAKNRDNNGDYIYNGIDRIDNTKGYTIKNVVPCCKTCNQAKNSLTLQEFKIWIKRVYKKTINDK